MKRSLKKKLKRKQYESEANKIPFEKRSAVQHKYATKEKTTPEKIVRMFDKFKKPIRRNK